MHDNPGWRYPRRGFLGRRRFTAALIVAAAGAGCSTGSPPAPTLIAPIELPTATAAPTAGKLLITRGGNFWLFDLATLQARQLTHFPQNTFVASPALSPDRRMVAFTSFVLPTSPSDLGGSDLSVMDVSGVAPRIVRPHGQPGVSFEEPCWTADGKAILATLRSTVYHQGRFQGVKVAIVRVTLDGSALTTLVSDAQAPAASPDGRRLAYLTANEQGVTTTLWVADAMGRGARDLLAGRGFVYLRAPRFSPSGDRLAFGGVGGPPAGRAMNASDGRVRRPVGNGMAWPPGPAVAEAHGIPWEIWTVRPDGRDLRRLTHLQEDSPIPAWSPDGTWLAVAGEIGLYLVDPAGQRTLRLSTSTSSGGLAWL